VIPAPLIQVWDATGATPLGILTGYAQVTVSDVLNDLGSLTLTFPRDVDGAELLDTEDDRQLKVILPGAPAMWFVNDDDASTWVSDAPESEPIQYTCRSLAGLLDEAVVYPGATFTTQTPGAIIASLFAAAQTRGLLQGLTLTGDATNDASGVAWPTNAPTVTYRVGTSLLAVLKGLADAGLLEWRMNARALEIHRIGGGLDRTLDVVLRPRRDVLAAPLTRSRRSIATAVVVEGASSSFARRTQTLTGRRAREEYVSQTSAPSGSLAAVGDLWLAAHAGADVQMTHDLTDTDGGPLPWVDYRAGDRIQTIAAGTGVSSRRVAQIALSMSPSDTKVTLELGSLLKTAEEQFDAKLRRILPGASSLT
jgi:hypothetical protein